VSKFACRLKPAVHPRRAGPEEFSFFPVTKPDTQCVRLAPTRIAQWSRSPDFAGWPPRTLAGSAVAERKAKPLAGRELEADVGFW
jgi:hypothetical protein